MGAIKAIETQYKGYRFRSRLEARWAVFFDALGLLWEYEPEGFVLSSGGKYLPDFKIPHCGFWVNKQPIIGGTLYVEVKPESVTNGELSKPIGFAIEMDRRSALLIAAGDPLRVCSGGTIPLLTSGGDKRDCDCGQKNCDTCRVNEFAAYVDKCGDDNCLQGSHLYLALRPKGDSEYRAFKKAATEAFDLPCRSAPFLSMKQAADLARSARFEHGEKPKIPFGRTTRK
jgi:hypothetical protein